MSETKMQVAQKSFSEMTPSEIVGSDKVKSKFVQLYQLMHGKNNGEMFYQIEQFHFLKQLSEKPELAKCDKLSLYGCLIDIAVNGLSFDPAMKQVYLVPFGNKCVVMVSPYGELYLRTRSGQIKYADNPVLVYEGDVFKTGTRNGEGFVEHEAKFPRVSDNIIACYVRIVRADDSVDYKVLSRPEIDKLRAASKQPNGAAWVNHFGGMVQAKTLKHAFRSYPRAKVRGQFAKIEEDTNLSDTIDYSFEEVASIAPSKIEPNQATNGTSISPEARVAQMTMQAEESSGQANDDDPNFD